MTAKSTKISGIITPIINPVKKSPSKSAPSDRSGGARPNILSIRNIVAPLTEIPANYHVYVRLGRMKKEKKKSYKKAIIIVSAIVAAYIISLFVPLISGYTRFPIYIVKCRNLPVIGYDLAGYSYKLSSSKSYGPSIFVSQYFCNETEAMRAGFDKKID